MIKILLLIALITNAQNLYVDSIISVYDGDTFKAKINTLPEFLNPFSIRINGIDCPEIRSSNLNEKAHAIIERNRADSILNTAKQVTLKNTKKGKYFRLVADVEVDNKKFDSIMIHNGICRPYNGEKRYKWSFY